MESLHCGETSIHHDVKEKRNALTNSQGTRKRKAVSPSDASENHQNVPRDVINITGNVTTHVTRQCRATEDPVLLRDQRVLDSLLAIEDRYLPSASYFNCVQKDIEPWMRNRVATWMLEVCEEQQCEEEVFPVSMNLLDRVLSVLPVRRTQLQLLASGCMFVASKLRETEALSARKLVIYTDHSITLQELIHWEALILQLLKWDTNAITPHDFLPQVLSRLPLPAHEAHLVQRHAQTFIALCLATEFRFALYPPSMIAAASIGTALQGLQGRKWCSDVSMQQRLQHITGIDLDCLAECQGQIEKALSRHLPQAVDGQTDGPTVPRTPDKVSPPRPAPTTPTDVRDIDFR